MVTVSQIVKKIVNESPMLQDAIIEDIVSIQNLAEKLHPRVKSELGDVKIQAIVMALRRHSENLIGKNKISKEFKFNTEIIMKTNLCDICIVKTPKALDSIKKLYHLVDYEKGETLNIIQGNYEITIVVSQKYLKKVKIILKTEKILNIEKNLVSLTLALSQDFLYTPGILSIATRKLAWENVNIFENISTMTEVIFILAQKDAVKAYNIFQDIVRD